MRELVLVRAVIIHRPDFLVAAAAANEIDFAFRDPGNAAAEAKDDLIGEFVRRCAGRVIGRRILILFAQHLRRGNQLRIEPVIPAPPGIRVEVEKWYPNGAGFPKI